MLLDPWECSVIDCIHVSLLDCYAAILPLAGLQQKGSTTAKKDGVVPIGFYIVSMVSVSYDHFSFACDFDEQRSRSLRHVITGILIPKRVKWVCREALVALWFLVIWFLLIFFSIIRVEEIRYVQVLGSLSLSRNSFGAPSLFYGKNKSIFGLYFPGSFCFCNFMMEHIQ